MNVRGISMCLLCAGALFVACGSKRGKTVGVGEQAESKIKKKSRYGTCRWW